MKPCGQTDQPHRTAGRTRGTAEPKPTYSPQRDWSQRSRSCRRVGRATPANATCTRITCQRSTAGLPQRIGARHDHTPASRNRVGSDPSHRRSSALDQRAGVLSAKRARTSATRAVTELAASDQTGPGQIRAAASGAPDCSARQAGGCLLQSPNQKPRSRETAPQTPLSRAAADPRSLPEPCHFCAFLVIYTRRS